MRISSASLLLSFALTACSRESTYRPAIENGDAGQGERHLIRYECGVCHTIDGIRGARGKVGPALEDYWRSVYVAGKFPNTPENLVAWIVNAPSMAPATAMPSLGVSAQEARDIAAFLYSQ